MASRGAAGTKNYPYLIISRHIQLIKLKMEAFGEISNFEKPTLMGYDYFKVIYFIAALLVAVMGWIYFVLDDPKLRRMILG